MAEVVAIGERVAEVVALGERVAEVVALGERTAMPTTTQTLLEGIV